MKVKTTLGAVYRYPIFSTISPPRVRHKELDGDGVFEQQKLREDHLEVPRSETGAGKV
jgi:hypothetical protein